VVVYTFIAYIREYPTPPALNLFRKQSSGGKGWGSPEEKGAGTTDTCAVEMMLLGMFSIGLF